MTHATIDSAARRDGHLAPVYRHEMFVQHATLRLARWHAPNPTGWCELCAEGMD